MGNQTRKRHGCGAGSKKYKRKVMQHGSNQHRTKDLDQIRTALKKTADLVADGKDAPGATFDPDLPGGGLFYCVETDRHFINQEALDKHKRTKAYKKRIRRLNEEDNYTQEEADRAGGIQTETLPPVGHLRPKRRKIGE